MYVLQYVRLLEQPEGPAGSTGGVQSRSATRSLRGARAVKAPKQFDEVRGLGNTRSGEGCTISTVAYHTLQGPSLFWPRGINGKMSARGDNGRI